MNRIILILLGTTFSCIATAQSSDKYLEQANKLYDDGNKKMAKELYQKAANLNNPEAHFALAYKYVVTKEQAIYHFAEAAKMGHSEGTAHILEALVFRAESLSMGNPELAYQIYQQAKRQNPNLKFYNEDGEIETIKQCIEAGKFDAKQFIEKYKITDKDTIGSDYAIWELAKEASRNGRFGKANPRLVLQLICRGGLVPAEVQIAVNDVYNQWKSNQIVEFDPCNYLASGIGLAYCSRITSKKIEEENLKIIAPLSKKLKNNAGSLLQNAYLIAGQFIELKAFMEEGHDGTGYVAWANASIDSQKKEYISFVELVNNGYTPKLNPQKNYDKELNETYRKLISELKKKPISTGFREITDHGILLTQRKWLKYRDNSAQLFSKISPTVSEQQWKDYLTEVRTKQLKENIQ